jgi:hypothetical protein
MDEIINSIDASLEELKAHIELLESIKATMKDHPVNATDKEYLESDLFQLQENVNDFGCSVSNIMYYMQRSAGFKIRVKLET